MRFVRWLFAAFALAVLAWSVLLTIVRLTTPGAKFWVLVASFVPYALIGYGLALVACLLVLAGSEGVLKRLLTGGVVLAVAGAVLHAVWLAPSYAGRHPGGAADLTVMSLNLHYGRGDAAQTVRTAAEHKVDLLVLEEISPAELPKLDAAGLSALLPQRYGWPNNGVAGTMVFSTYKLAQQTQLDLVNGAFRMRVLAPKPFWLVALHTSQPLKDTKRWRADLAKIRAEVADLSGPRLLVGDFNATLDHGPMRSLLDTGLRDAAEEANSGWQPTWPTGQRTNGRGRTVPIPVFTIDHVLMSSQFGSIDTKVFTIKHTDHRALVARLKG